MADFLVEDELGGDGGDQAIYWYDPKIHELDKYKRLIFVLSIDEVRELLLYLEKQYIDPNQHHLYKALLRMRAYLNGEMNVNRQLD